MRARSLRAVAGVVLSASLIACSGGVAPPPSGSRPSGPSTSAPPTIAASQAPLGPTTVPSTRPGPGDVVFDGTIDVGHGRAFTVPCVGVGSPTIVLLSESWPPAFVYQLAQSTTTCSYGWPDDTSGSPLPEPTLAKFLADSDGTLARLHREAGIEGPYVFVGWSFGGHVALAEALSHPDDTAGLVILDTDFDTDFLAECRDSGRSATDCHGEFDGNPAFAMGAELRTMLHPLPPSRFAS